MMLSGIHLRKQEDVSFLKEVNWLWYGTIVQCITVQE
nr:MAG TPA: hypothetical protein [Bacteriophage sp.]